MSEERPEIDKTRLRRVTVVVRSWDGPNSRVGLEMDLNQMPWGPFDALGQKLTLLLPAAPESRSGGPDEESEVSRALRHVEHAADRCAEFARTSDTDRDRWLTSLRTWEWIRRQLTHLWVQEEVEGDAARLLESRSEEVPTPQETPAGLPTMPGAAQTLEAAATALRSTSLSVWREAVESGDPEAPTREEAIQTLLGVAKILDTRGRGEEIMVEVEAPHESATAEQDIDPEEAPKGEAGFEQVTIDFAEGYDQGYHMGRKVGWALGSKRRKDREKTGR
jgi:hypothetical protein